MSVSLLAVISIPPLLRASYTLASDAAPLALTRAGALSEGAPAPIDDPLVAAFEIACAFASRTTASGLRVRASAPEGAQDAAGACAVAGVVAADALLGLGFDAARIARLASLVVDDASAIDHAVNAHRVAVHTICDDDSVGAPSRHMELAR